jgi:hypothetical protein
MAQFPRFPQAMRHSFLDGKEAPGAKLDIMRIA